MIQYDEPRTWWKYDFLSQLVVPIDCVGEAGSYVIDKSDSPLSKTSHSWRLFETRQAVEEFVAARDAAYKSSEEDAARQSAALSACDGVPTERLIPGCVALLVEALERIRDSQTINPDGWGHMTEGDMQQIADEALAAMKGE